ncbi:MAG: hypothetical protein JWN78_3169 [Bacteroidota bacterium]|nr:hypothetical protein [Bacteroidota bacterium]
MQLNEEKAEFINKIIDEWRSQELITAEQAEKLKQSYTVRKFDWKQVTVYAFIIAVICCVLSIIVLLADQTLQQIIEKFTQITDLGISSILTAITLFLFWYTRKRFREHSTTPISNNSFLLVASFMALATISYWAKTIHVFEHNYSFIFLLAAVMYLVLSLYYSSQTLWVMSILMLAFAYGVFSAFYNNNEMKFFGMNYPVRFLPFSMVILSLTLLINMTERLRRFFKIHFISSLLLFYFSLWLITIFGNYSSLERWNDTRQVEFIGYDILLFAISAAGMYLGLKRNDHILGNISLSFFIINLITRYFEYFWEPLHKSVFFMILALIFWFIGSRAERLWNLKFLEEK